MTEEKEVGRKGPGIYQALLCARFYKQTHVDTYMYFILFIYFGGRLITLQYCIGFAIH